jgi:dTDP-glucose 4,6-dehydratase
VYDEAKRFAEAMTMAYHRFHGVETRIVRIFNTYGERMRINDGRVVPAFICQALRDEPLTVFGDGSQTRSFCYVSDLVEGIYRLLMSDETLPVNIGNPAEMTVLQFAERIKRLTGTRAPIEFRPLPEDDPKIRRPDITKARKLLGWEPRVPLDEGLQRTIDYFRSVVL